jgi:hypothetical protein
MNRIEPVSSTPEPKSQPSTYWGRASSIATGHMPETRNVLAAAPARQRWGRS